MIHRFELERYKGKTSRYECPACHKRDVFARYVDIETGEYLSDEVGRCNREDRCGYHYTPKQYFEEHPDDMARRPNGKSEEDALSRAAPRAAQVPPRRTIDYIPSNYLDKSLGYGSNFVLFLCSLFDLNTLESPTIERLMSNYYLGQTKNGAVVYWQIDENRRIRTGKIMQYAPETGKRVKDMSGAIDWVHARLKRAGVLPQSWELSQCLFGEHLLSLRKGETVGLVESEKTALICAGAMPEYIWLATGGKQNLKADKCRCLKGRRVIVFPDLGAFDVWQEKAKLIAGQVGFSVTVSSLLENAATGQDRENGLDVADYLIRELSNQTILPTSAKRFRSTNEPENIQEAEANAPRLLLPMSDKQALRYLGNLNPRIFDLVEALDLITP